MAKIKNMDVIKSCQETGKQICYWGIYVSETFLEVSLVRCIEILNMNN